jgi:hypothetical protein
VKGEVWRLPEGVELELVLSQVIAKIEVLLLMDEREKSSKQGKQDLFIQKLKSTWRS